MYEDQTQNYDAESHEEYERQPSAKMLPPPLGASDALMHGITVSVIHAVVASLLLYTLCNLCQMVPKICSLADYGGYFEGQSMV